MWFSCVYVGFFFNQGPFLSAKCSICIKFDLFRKLVNNYHEDDAVESSTRWEQGKIECWGLIFNSLNSVVGNCVSQFFIIINKISEIINLQGKIAYLGS